MPWNQPDQKSSASAAAGFLHKLNCFEGGRFHPLRFSVLLAFLLIAVAVAHEASAAQPSPLRKMLVEEMNVLSSVPAETGAEAKQ